jgi:predicted phosphodiesterase
MVYKKRRYRRRNKLAQRVVRSVISIVILSALVLGVSFFVKEVATLDGEKVARLTNPLFSRIGVSEDSVGDVAGEFIERLSETDIGSFDSAVKKEEDTLVEESRLDLNEETTLVENAAVSVKHLILEVAIMADSEDDFDNLEEALSLVVERNISAVIFLGDFSKWGTEESLSRSKDILDASDLKYYSIPGDHDLAKSVQDGDLTGLAIYSQVFGSNSHSVLLEGVKLVILDNSANYTAIDSDLVSWFVNEVVSADFVLLSQPLYHPTNSRIMGMVEGEEVAAVRAQAEDLLDVVRNSGVKAIIAADQHMFSRNSDPVRDSLDHVVVGALVGNSEEFRNLQTPRFCVLKVFDDGSYEVEQVVL